jgi:hypothetical protein
MISLRSFALEKVVHLNNNAENMKQIGRRKEKKKKGTSSSPSPKHQTPLGPKHPRSKKAALKGRSISRI